MNMAKIEVKGTSITVVSGGVDDYISLTDIARYKDSDHTDDIIRNWLRNRNTLEFLGIWEQLNNPIFNPVEFDGIRMQAGLNSFNPDAQTMDRGHPCHRYQLQGRALWRHLCPQRHCFRVRVVGVG